MSPVKKPFLLPCLGVLWALAMAWSCGKVLLPALLCLPPAVLAAAWQQRRGQSGYGAAVLVSCLVAEAWVFLTTPVFMRQYLLLLCVDALLVAALTGVTAVAAFGAIFSLARPNKNTPADAGQFTRNSDGLAG
jgi:hypothetical protein